MTADKPITRAFLLQTYRSSMCSDENSRELIRVQRETGQEETQSIH